MSGWVGVGRWASCWPSDAGGAGKSDGLVGENWGALTKLKQLSGSPLWQQSKLWLGRRLPVLLAPTLRLSRISLSKSSSSPDPRKLLSRASSAHGSWASSGLRAGALGKDGKPQMSARPPSPNWTALEVLEFRDHPPHQSWPSTSNIVPSPAFETYTSSRDSEGVSSSRLLLLGRRGRFCKGQIWRTGPQELQNQVFGGGGVLSGHRILG